jgi:hypothetical protein
MATTISPDMAIGQEGVSEHTVDPGGRTGAIALVIDGVDLAASEKILASRPDPHACA